MEFPEVCKLLEKEDFRRMMEFPFLLPAVMSPEKSSNPSVEVDICPQCAIDVGEVVEDEPPAYQRLATAFKSRCVAIALAVTTFLNWVSETGRRWVDSFKSTWFFGRLCKMQERASDYWYDYVTRNWLYYTTNDFEGVDFNATPRSCIWKDLHYPNPYEQSGAGGARSVSQDDLRDAAPENALPETPTRQPDQAAKKKSRGLKRAAKVFRSKKRVLRASCKKFVSKVCGTPIPNKG